MKKILYTLAIVLAVVFTSCKKPAGSGGQATITGKVHVTNFSMTAGIYVENGQYYGPDEDVYLIYGDDNTYSERNRTGPNGEFEFRYLRPGSYRVYVFSKDKDAIVAGNAFAPMIAKEITVTIGGKKETVDGGTIEIYR